MQDGPFRETVDLSGYPDLVMILLGLRLKSFRALAALPRIGRGLAVIRRVPPDGLLGQDQFLWGWNHVGIRHYWRDAEALERFTKAEPHGGWWRDFMRDTQGSGFWHELYRARGGVEAIYVAMPERIGLASFAPPRKPIGPFMSSADRLRADTASR